MDRVTILKSLKKGARVKLMSSLLDEHNNIIIKHGTYGYKTRNGRGQFERQMVLYIGGKMWYISYHSLTCDILEVTEKMLK